MLGFQAPPFAARRLRLTGAVGSALAIALLLGSAGPAAAQWKWRDRNGQLVISDVPPPQGTPEKDIMGRPAGAQRSAAPAQAAPAASPALAGDAASAPQARASGPAEPELEARRQKAEADEKAKRQAAEEAEAQRRADNCQRAKRQLAALESGQRMARLNDKGEREILDDKARGEEVQRTRDIVTSDCKG